MARAGRVLVCGFAAGAVALFVGALRSSASQSPAGNESKLESAAPTTGRREAIEPRNTPPSSGTLDGDIARFVGLLDRLRSDDEGVLPEMRELADRLCKVHDRCDGREILEYYAALPGAARTKGRGESAKADAAWSRLHDRLTSSGWDPGSDPDVALLRAFAALDGTDSDVCPSAMASSFLAYIDLERPPIGEGSSEADRAEWMERTAEEARRSIAGFAKCGMRLRTLMPLWILARLELEAGHDREAETQFRDCLSLARRLGNADWRERSLDSLIQLAKRAGDLGEVAVLLDELASFRTPDTSWVLTAEKAFLLLELDYASTAGEFLSEHRPSRASDIRDWKVLLARTYLRKGDLEAARDAFASAEAPPWKKDVKLGMALVDLRAGNAQRALDQLSTPEFVEDPDPYARAFVMEIRGEALIRLNRLEEATRVLEAALEIGGRIQTRIAAARNPLGATTSVIGESVGVHAIALLAEAQILSGRFADAARSIEGWQSRTLRQASGVSEDVSTEDLLAWAKSAGGGLITWVVGADSTAVAFVAPDGASQGAVIPRGRRAIDAAVRRLNDAVRSDDLVLADRLGTQVLAEILPEPLGRRVRERRESGDRILLLLHGPLERLPVEFLFRSDRTCPLVLPGIPEARPGDPIVPNDLTHWNVLGHPIDAEGRARLPGAREELSQVATLHGAHPGSMDAGGVLAADGNSGSIRMHIGTAFDRRSFLEALAAKEPLHVATHLVAECGEKNGRIAGVGLELSNGESLCAREILDARPKLPLAVISACETAEGRFVDAEGLQGVARAFLESGTRNLVVTLWPVEDGAARDFAQSFHRALIAGELPADAAASARARLVRDGRPAADWAGFRVIGRD